MVDAGQAGPLSLGQRLRSETVFAFWSVVPNQHLVEAVTRSGYGGIVIDAQHGLHDFASIERLVPSIVSCGAGALVRLPLGDLALGARALDVGCAAVIVPMVNTADEAKAAVAAMKYPPMGARSYGPLRGLAYSGLERTDYVHRANHITTLFAMVETETALRNLDAIAAVEGHRRPVRRPERSRGVADPRPQCRSRQPAGHAGGGEGAAAMRAARQDRRHLCQYAGTRPRLCRPRLPGWSPWATRSASPAAGAAAALVAPAQT